MTDRTKLEEAALDLASLYRHRVYSTSGLVTYRMHDAILNVIAAFDAPDPAHEFVLALNVDPTEDRLANALYAAGCDDGACGAVDALGYIHFTRRAPTLAAAVASARRDVESVEGVSVEFSASESVLAWWARETWTKLAPSPPTRGWILEQIAKVSEKQRGKAPWRKVPPLGDAPDPVPALEAPAPPAVGSRGTHRGHPMLLVGDVWCYADTREPVADNPARPCGHCSMPNRADGHDACLGVIPGAMNACCGHGDEAARYVQVDPEPAHEVPEPEPDYEGIAIALDKPWPSGTEKAAHDNDPGVPCDHGGTAPGDVGPVDPPQVFTDEAMALCAGGYSCPSCRNGRLCGNGRDVRAALAQAHAAGRAERDAEPPHKSTVGRVALDLARYCTGAVSTLTKQGNIACALAEAHAAGRAEMAKEVRPLLEAIQAEKLYEPNSDWKQYCPGCGRSPYNSPPHADECLVPRMRDLLAKLPEVDR